MTNVQWQLRHCLVCHPRHVLKSRPPLIPIVARLHTGGSLRTFSPSSLLPLLSPLVPALTLPSDKIKGPSEAAWDSGFILFVLCAQWGPVRESVVFFVFFARPVQEAPQRISGSLRGIWQKSHRLYVLFLGLLTICSPICAAGLRTLVSLRNTVAQDGNWEQTVTVCIFFYTFDTFYTYTFYNVFTGSIFSS